VQVEARLRQLEGKVLSSASGAGKGKSTGQPSPYDKDRKGGGAAAGVSGPGGIPVAGQVVHEIRTPHLVLYSPSRQG